MTKADQGVVVAIIIATLALLGNVYIEATHNDRDNAQRISSLEAHQSESTSKIDHIQSQVDKLVEWALGKK